MQLLAKIKLPHTLVLIFFIIIFVALLTWLLPGGQYQRTTNAQGREIVVDGTFSATASKPQGVAAVLKAPVTGIVETAHIIGFILLIGGVFSILQKTGVIDISMRRLAERLRDKGILVIPIGMCVFSLFGAVFGMSEEVIPFVLIFIPLALALGYDSIVGVAIPFLGAGLGFAGAMLNPFTLGIAQGIAELPLFSGMGYRILVWIIVTSAGIFLVLRYAVKIKRDPHASPVYALDRERLEKKRVENAESTVLSFTHKCLLILFGLAILLMIFGVIKYKWFITEIAALFLGLGIAAGFVSRLPLNTMAEQFVEGAKDLIGAALVVGFARAILILARDGQIIDTIMHALSSLISAFHPVIAAILMYVMQTIINFFVPSGSGQAALTMPILAPLADLVGVTRQTAVLAFQLGDGFTNMIIPTSGVTMGVLGMAKLPWNVWAKWLLPLEIIFFLLGVALLIPPHFFGWGPF